MQKIVIGFNNIEICLNEVKSKRCMLVCGHSFDSSFLKEYIDSLNVEFVRFSDFKPNPLYEDVCSGVKLFKQSDCDCILAIGGGSAIDVAKCIKLYCKLRDDKLFLQQECFDSKVPLIALPTTAGTGSESTRFAVIYYEGNKQSVVHPSIIPDYAILEPKVLKNLPLYQKKCTLMDALCQAIESWWSINSTDESRKYSKEAIELIISHWEKYIDNWDYDIALVILKAANLAGKAIDISQTTAAHAFCYKLTSMYGLPHGHAVAVCLPEIWNFMKHSDLLVFKEISSAMGYGNDIDAAINKFREMMRVMCLDKPKSNDFLSDVDILSKSVNPVRLMNNPVPISQEEAKEIYGNIVENVKPDDNINDLTKYNPKGSMLRNMQIRLVEILVAIDKVFRSNSIEYWLEYGTLLGAARHKGFIPWDDDIDICIRRKDYSRARKALKKELPDQFVFQDYTTDKYAFSNYARVRDIHSKCNYPLFRLLKEQGLWVDIFISDTVPSDSVKIFVDNLYRRTFHETHHYGDVAYTSYSTRLFKKAIAYILHPFSLLLLHSTNFIGRCMGSKWEGVYGVNWYRICQNKYIFPLSELEFEGHKFLTPGNWDAHLREIYGDYMQIPPEEKRKHTLDLTKVEIW